MLTRLAFDGYRSFPARRRFDRSQPLQELDLAPLTLVIGRNNAGKTSVLSLLHSALYALAGDGPTPLPLTLGGRRVADRFADMLPERDTLSVMEWHLSLRNGHESHDLCARLMLEDNLDRHAGPTVSERYWDGEAYPPPPGPLQGSLLPETLPQREALRAEARALLSRSVWLGPLRTGTPAAPALGERPSGAPPIGPAGEGVSALLAKDQPLFQGVASWLREHADLPLRWEINLDQRRLLARRGRGGAEVSIAHTGDGVHQVLPVVTLATLRRLDRNSTFLDVVQQPELHLHDALHPALGDLFLGATAQSKGVMVVETHAEGLLLRVRRRIAEGSVDPARVALYYVDDAPEGSTLQRVQLLPDGEVEGWPEGVFLERYQEVRAIRRAQRSRG
ncbi:MAG: hypothetical protein JXX28_13855 [Deltaproteobacteria bacterium]|nr:hypothetical protein [Deltaproteobacteria bacterium]